MRKILITLIAIMLLFSCASVKKTKIDMNTSMESSKGKSKFFIQDAPNGTSEPEPNIVPKPVIKDDNKNTEVVVLAYRKKKKIEVPVGPNIINVTNNRVYKNTSQMGNVVYKIPNVMHVRNSYQVLVRISKSEANIYEDINGDVKHSVIPITETMQVNLIDDSPTDSKNFDVVKDNDSVQLVDTNGTYTQWSWNVTPLKVGTGKLKVVISVIRDGNRKDVVYSDDITIKMDLPKQISFWVNKYWQWIMTSIIIPFIVWLYKKFKKKEEKDETDTNI